MRIVVFGLSLLLLSTEYARAQKFVTEPCPNFHADRIESNSILSEQQRACELRRTTFPVVHGEINMNPANGSIEIVGEDRQDVALEARVEAQSSSQSDAESILHRINIVTDGAIDGMGPTPASSFHGTWSVSYRLRVPQHVNARIHSLNGSISLMNVDGNLDLSTTNGALSLNRVAGDVRARTINGAIAVALDGKQWDGHELTVASVNGAITVEAPAGYSGHLLTSSGNSVIAAKSPFSELGVVHGDIDRNIGQGGPLLLFETVNGPIAISQSQPGAGS